MCMEEDMLMLDYLSGGSGSTKSSPHVVVSVIDNIKFSGLNTAVRLPNYNTYTCS